MTLIFAEVKCEGCGEDRVAAQPCPGCGQSPAPEERDDEAGRRRSLVTRIRNRHQPAPAVQPFADVDEALSERAQVLSDMVQALNAASNDASAEADLEAAFGAMDRHLARAALLLPRPERNTGRAHLISSRRMQASFEAWLEAFAAPTVQAATDIGKRAQELLDEALNQAPQEVDLSHAVDAQSLVSNDRLLAERFGRWGIGDEPGSGIAAFLLMDSARGCFDEERCYRLVEVVRDLPSSDALRSLSRDPAWRQGELAMNETLSSAARGLDLRVEDETGTTRDAVDAALRLLGDMREHVARHSIATILECTGGATYQDTRRWTSGRFLKHATTMFPQLELDRLDRRLRDAGAHASLAIREDRVVIDGHSNPVTFTEAEFLDAVLHDMETLWSVAVGAGLALRRASPADDAFIELLDARQILVIVEVLLRAGGCGASKVRMTGTEVVGQVTHIPDKVLTAVAASTPLLPATVDSFRLEERQTRRTYEMPVAPIRAFQLTDAAAREPATWLVLASERLDGRPTQTAEEWRRLIAHCFAETQGQMPAIRARRLLQLRPAVEASGHPDAPTFLREALAVVRSESATSSAIPSSFRRS